ESGSTVILEVVSDSNWEFESWSGDIVSIVPFQTFVISANMILTATFVEISSPQFSLNISQIGMGSVAVNGIDYVETLQFDPDTVVSIVATAGQGWKFIGWNGDFISENTEIELLIESNVSITATFAPIQSAELIPDFGYFDEESPANPTTTIVWNDASSVTTIVRIDNDQEVPIEEGVDYSITYIDDDTSLLTLFMTNKRPKTNTKAEFYIDFYITFDFGNPIVFPVLYTSVVYYLVDFNIVDDSGNVVNGARIQFDNIQYDPGHHEFPNIQSGYHSYKVECEGYAPIYGSAQVLDDDLTLNIILHRLFMVRFVAHNNSIPLQNVEIEVNNSIIYTDIVGTADILLKNGTYTYIARFTDFHTVENSFAINGASENVEVSMTHVVLPQSEMNKTRLYPNPVENVLYVEHSSSVLGYIEIVNIVGSVVLRKTISSSKYSIDIHGLEPGIYYIRFNRSAQSVLRFVKL
ncbi:MAG: T9SS type A sorting domain-containing protein, partial [Salinivirgaceae bacterium]|nr:T9SS type A sorting domain-containing protein [Salinivirgaceae bacterium]